MISILFLFFFVCIQAKKINLANDANARKIWSLKETLTFQDYSYSLEELQMISSQSKNFGIGNDTIAPGSKSALLVSKWRRELVLQMIDFANNASITPPANVTEQIELLNGVANVKNVFKYIHRTPAFSAIMKSQYLKNQVWLASGVWLPDYSGKQNYLGFSSNVEMPWVNGTSWYWFLTSLNKNTDTYCPSHNADMSFAPNNTRNIELLRIGCGERDCAAERAVLGPNSIYTKTLCWFRQFLMEWSLTTLARVYAGDRANLLFERNLRLLPRASLSANESAIVTTVDEFRHGGVYFMNRTADHLQAFSGIFVFRQFNRNTTSTGQLDHEFATLALMTRTPVVTNETSISWRHGTRPSQTIDFLDVKPQWSGYYAENPYLEPAQLFTQISDGHLTTQPPPMKQ
mmetsp:Transcript_8550/g.14757  ORF Transcript_8550/g.14757 Transcript_8550/m.14757 type:complete len:403 (-) Transcript_8550:33-1241(-)